MTTTTGKRGPAPGAFNELNTAGSGGLFEARALLGLSRPAIGEKIGMGMRAIQSAENRGSLPTGDAAEKLLALVADLPADQLTPILRDFIETQKARYNQLAAIFGDK